MANVPTNLIPSRITSLPEAPVADPAGYFPIVISGTTYKVQFSQIQGNVEVPASRQIIAGTGLTGGGTLSQNITIAVANGGIGNDQLDTTGVAAGSYGTGSDIPVVTVNSKGRVTSISTTSVIVTGYVSDNIQVVAGTGLTGGGTLTQNRTLSIDYAATTPSSLGTASAGSASTPARIDHVHPALNLSDSTQTSGALPMGRGGTGTALSPIAGAIVYSTGSQFAIGSPGSVGQVLVSGGAGAYTWGSVQLITPVAANSVFAGPTSGPNDDPSFRALVNADIPATLNGKTIESATITNALSLTAVSGNITTLTSSSGTITNLTGTSGTIDTLAGTSWTVTNLTATSATISNFTFTSSTVTDLTATRLTATSAHITTLSSGSATLTNLTSTSGTVSTLKSTSADITNVSATSLTLSSALKVGSGGTGLSLTPTNGQLLIGNGNGYTLASLTAGTGVSVTNATGSITLANTAPDQTVTVTSGTNISVTGTYPSFTVSSPDTVVGPAGATSGAIALYDGGTGKLVKNSAITINASGVISNVNTPNTGTDAANKQYVDDLVSTGIHIHTPVVLATSPGSSRTDTYNNGTAGVSATLTSVANGTLVIDGTVASATIRVLIQDCSNPIGNGVYVVTNAGSAAAQYVMTRSSDADTAGQQSTQSLDDGSYFFTTGGTSNKGASWVNTNTGNISFGSTAITFSQFSASQVYSAGNGLSLTATTFSLDTPVSVLNGGVGLSSAPTNGQLLIGNGAGYTLAGLTAGTGVSVTNATGSITLANTAPDQTVIITGSGIVSVTGTYPSFTVGAVETYSGTVTSVDGSSTVSGFTLSGGPITTSGRLTLAGTLAISNGGTGASTQSGARTALGLGTMATQDASSVVITGGSIGSSVLVNLTNATGNISGGTY